MSVAEHSPFLRQKAAEATSKINESRRWVDFYTFDVGESGSLLIPDTKIPITDRMSKTGYPNEAEYEAVLRIQDWVAGGGAGVCLWISPSGPYKESSVVISNANGELLENRKMIFGFGAQRCLEIANKLVFMMGGTSKSFASVEDLRASPLFLDIAFSDAVNLLEHTINHPKYWSDIRAGVDVVVSESVYRQLLMDPNKASGMYGSATGSCDEVNTPFSVFSRGPNEGYFSCPKCKGKIESGKGITKCPHCGVTKEEYGSKCD